MTSETLRKLLVAQAALAALTLAARSQEGWGGVDVRRDQPTSGGIKPTKDD